MAMTVWKEKDKDSVSITLNKNVKVMVYTSGDTVVCRVLDKAKSKQASLQYEYDGSVTCWW